MKGERDEQTEYHRAGHAAAVVGRWRNGSHDLLGLVSAESILARIIHERVCCNREFAAATSLLAGGLAVRLAVRLRTFATNRHESCGLGVCPSHTFLLRQTSCRYLRRSRPETILNVFQ